MGCSSWRSAHRVFSIPAASGSLTASFFIRPAGISASGHREAGLCHAALVRSGTFAGPHRLVRQPHNENALRFYRRMGGTIIHVDTGNANPQEDQVEFVLFLCVHITPPAGNSPPVVLLSFLNFPQADQAGGDRAGGTLEMLGKLADAGPAVIQAAQFPVLLLRPGLPGIFRLGSGRLLVAVLQHAVQRPDDVALVAHMVVRQHLPGVGAAACPAR